MGLPAPAAGAAGPEPGPAPLSEGQKALAAAGKSGQRVEVAGERTERSTVFANPDGFTFTLEESAVPVRVAKSGGGWQAPDATLVRRADGTVGPKAAAVGLAFSAGGSGKPLAEISDQGRSLELSWPGPLPEPQLDGAGAVYPDVLPDVDLKVTATPESFQHVLVVKTPEAAALPRLKELEFGLTTDGLTVRKGESGNLVAVDGDGRTVFKAPPAQMWNSAGRAEAEQQPAPVKLRAPASAAASEDEEPKSPADPAESAPSGSGLEPGQGDDVARMDVDLAGDSLSVVPDAGLLAETDPAAFPLFIDPTVTWGESERTLLRSDGYESYGWGNGADDRGKGVGKCGTWGGYSCGPGYVQRLYFEFSPASLKGKKVLDATFRATETWSFTCDARWVDLVRTNNISSSTTWSSRPKELDWMGDRHVSAGRGTACSPSQPSAAIEFNDNPAESNENLTPTVRDFAAGKFSRLTLELRAHDESDTSAWKRFRNDAVLAVDFVGLPAKPSGIGIVSGSSTVCETTENDPVVVSDPTPALTATAQTASGGEKDAQLRVYFDVDHKNGDGTWSDTSAGNGDLRPSSGYVGDGVKLTMSWSALSDDTTYRYRAWVRSYYDGGKNHLSGPSNASTTGWCYFRIDSSAPEPPVITVGSPYTPCTPQDCRAHGGPGEKAAFTFAPPSGETGIVAYQHKPSEGAWSPKKSGSTVSVDVTPQRSGTHTLHVRAYDSFGRYRDSAVDFLVAAGEGPVGRWHFDETTGAAKDSATAAGSARRDATLGAGAVRDDRGRRGLLTHGFDGTPLETPLTDRGLSLDGAGAYAATSGPVLETRSAYTVSAWARLDSTAQDGIVLSQDGANYSSFLLWYETSYDAWVFGVKEKDEDNGQAYFGVVAKAPAAANVWTHLAGTYDPATQQLRLYVNGLLQGTRTVPGSWSSSGSFNMGRYLWAGKRYWPFDGSIDEVAAWQRALLPSEIAQEARLLTSEGFNGAELVADWSAERGSGASIADTTSGYGRSLALTGGASIQSGAIALDGVDDAAGTAGPLVDDTGSFTVTTLASLDGNALASRDVGYTGQVLGQRTADGSAWGFWFEMTGKDTVLDEETFEERTVPVGRWHFGRLNADGAFSSVVSDEVAALDAEVRLTGVFDAQDGTVSLRLGSLLNGAPLAFTAKAGAGDFAIGRAFASGGWRHHLPARITEVRLWAGAMAGQEQIELRVGD
ncbi:LamG-like jellyroll fold domain-containing protein [Streptomyces pratensis]